MKTVIAAVRRRSRRTQLTIAKVEGRLYNDQHRVLKLVSVPDPKPTLVWIILEVIYAPDEVC